jgi:hypothetical protein
MAWLHPVLGAVAVALTCWVATQGLRARHRARYAPAARAHHRRWASTAFVLVLASAVLGTLSVRLLRSDLTPAASWHFRTGWGAAALMTLGALTSRSLPKGATARRVHPWLGLLALAAAVLGAVLGIDMLP